MNATKTFKKEVLTVVLMIMAAVAILSFRTEPVQAGSWQSSLPNSYISPPLPLEQNARLDYRETGDLDPDFGDDGKVVFSLKGCDLRPQNMVRQPDGRFVVIGTIGQDLNAAEECIATSHRQDIILVRFNADGSVDYDFGFLGMWIYDIDEDDHEIVGVAAQPDGKILVGLRQGGTIVRFNANGSIDSSFGSNGFFNSFDAIHGITEIPKQIAVQPDGKIVISGNRWSNPGDFPYSENLESSAFVRRLNSNGTDDPSFGTSHSRVTIETPKGTFSVNSMILQPNGKILLAGSRSNESFSLGVLARLNTDGSLDSTFGTDGVRSFTYLEIDGNRIEDFTFAKNQLALQSNGKIVLGGRTRPPSATHQPFMARFSSNGEIDNSFSGDGVILPFNLLPDNAENIGFSSLLTQPNDFIVWAGDFKNPSPNDHYDFLVARYTPEGVLDTTFADDGQDGVVNTDFSPLQFTRTNDGMRKAMLLPNGKILALGSKPSGEDVDIILARYLGDQVTLPFIKKNRTTLTSHLSGRNSVPQFETPAQGQSIFHFNQSATELEYKINLSNIQGVTSINVYEGGVTDEIGRMRSSLSFLNPQTCSVRSNSVRCEGKITNRNVIEQFIDMIEDERANFVVTTTRYPTGELRARIPEEDDR